MCRHAPTRHTHTATPTPSTRQQATHACHTTHAHASSRHPRASKLRTPATPHTRTPAIRAPASPARLLTPPLLMRRGRRGGGAGWDARPRPPRLLRSGARRFQHVPPCTNATHAHSATPPLFTRQQAAHACHTAHTRTTYPRLHAPASRARLPLPMRRGRHSWRRVRRTASPAETLEIGRTPLPACAVVHQRDTRSLCHTPAVTRQQVAHTCHTAHAHACRF